MNFMTFGYLSTGLECFVVSLGANIGKRITDKSCLYKPISISYMKMLI